MRCLLIQQNSLKRYANYSTHFLRNAPSTTSPLSLPRLRNERKNLKNWTKIQLYRNIRASTPFFTLSKNLRTCLSIKLMEKRITKDTGSLKEPLALYEGWLLQEAKDLGTLTLHVTLWYLYWGMRQMISSFSNVKFRHLDFGQLKIQRVVLPEQVRNKEVLTAHVHY